MSSIDADIINAFGEEVYNKTKEKPLFGIFDNEYETIMESGSSVPVLTLLDDSPVDFGDVIDIRGTEYVIREIMPDRTGLKVITLE